MPLPDLIEIVPLTGPVQAEITVPGSKSITNRALVLAALAAGETILHGALWSEDTQVMVECLQELGFMANVAPDPNETCNRTITVYGLGGKVPRGGTAEQPLELFVGNAGTAARFLAAMLCLGEGVYRLHGVPRMHERPQAALFQALRELGYRVDSPNDKLPALIHGGGSRGDEAPIKNAARRTRNAEMDQSLLTSAATNGRRRSCTVSIEESSQFASALLLCADAGGWKIEVAGENAEESPYVAMTSKLIEVFPKSGGTFQIEPDASSGSYFWAADFVQWVSHEDVMAELIRVSNWPSSGLQIDQDYRQKRFFFYGARWKLGGRKRAEARLEMTSFAQSRKTDLADAIMTAIVTAPLVPQPLPLTAKITFSDLGRLRHQECERVEALRTELTKCGARVDEIGDALEISLANRFYGPELHAPKNFDGRDGVIETYNDHRMAMCFAILGLKVPGIKIKNPACVKKTFPNFFQKLAALPPGGLGVTILDAATGRRLTHEELFAD